MSNGTVITTTTFKFSNITTDSSHVQAKYYLAVYTFPLNASGPIASGTIDMDLMNQTKVNNTITTLGYDLSLEIPFIEAGFWLVVFADSQLQEPLVGVYFLPQDYPSIALKLIEDPEQSQAYLLNVTMS